MKKWWQSNLFRFQWLFLFSRYYFHSKKYTFSKIIIRSVSRVDYFRSVLVHIIPDKETSHHALEEYAATCFLYWSSHIITALCFQILSWMLLKNTYLLHTIPEGVWRSAFLLLFRRFCPLGYQFCVCMFLFKMFQ